MCKRGDDVPAAYFGWQRPLREPLQDDAQVFDRRLGRRRIVHAGRECLHRDLRELADAVEHVLLQVALRPDRDAAPDGGGGVIRGGVGPYLRENDLLGDERSHGGSQAYVRAFPYLFRDVAQRDVTDISGPGGPHDARLVYRSR